MVLPPLPRFHSHEPMDMGVENRLSALINKSIAENSYRIPHLLVAFELSQTTPWWEI